MRIQISDFLAYLDTEKIEYSFVGDTEIDVTGFCSLNKPKEDAITWIKKPKEYDLSKLNQYKALCIVTSFDGKRIYQNTDKTFIFCHDPKEVYFMLLTKFFYSETYEPGIHKTAVVETPHYGKNLYVGANTYIGSNVSIGDSVIIKNNVSIEGCVIIGDRTIIHSGCVLGTDGYGYFKDSKGINQKVPHFGGIEIGHDVEIGANTCIDHGTLDDTMIGDYVKIDNLCHIGHNVIIEENSMVIALSMLGGSAHLKKDAYLAPNATIMNQITIGKNALVGLGSVVTKDVEDNKIVAGVPAKVIRERD